MPKQIPPIIPIAITLLLILAFLVFTLLKPTSLPVLPQPTPSAEEKPTSVPTQEIETSQVTQIAEIKAVEDINDIDATPNGKYVFVPSFDEGIVYEIEVETDLITKQIPIELPYSLAVSPDGRKLFVATGQREVLVWDLREQKEIGRVSVGAKPYALCFADNGKKLFVSNNLSGTVSVIDMENLKLLTTIPVGKEPKGLAFLGNFLYVANWDDASLSIISANNLTAVGEIFVGGRPNEVLADKEKGLVYVTDSYNNQVLVVDVTKNEVVKKITVDEFPFGMAKKGENELLVASFGQNTLSVIDLETLALTKTIGTSRAFLNQSGFNHLVILESLRKIYLINTMNGKILVYSY